MTPNKFFTGHLETKFLFPGSLTHIQTRANLCCSMSGSMSGSFYLLYQKMVNFFKMCILKGILNFETINVCQLATYFNI